MSSITPGNARVRSSIIDGSYELKGSPSYVDDDFDIACLQHIEQAGRGRSVGEHPDRSIRVLSRPQICVLVDFLLQPERQWHRLHLTTHGLEAAILLDAYVHVPCRDIDPPAAQ